ncbi:unnamed protein product [Phytomonas sp. Hart1]|nr:unnamed protein product [Phytomonas sp. Hart1]|eukprot:CCW71500.1 unnamed protein product [Phytomonas sp. isolate Hart1]
MAFDTKVEAFIKVLLIGDSGVGKSSLLHSFTTGIFNESIGTTIGIDFKVKKVDILDEITGQHRHVNMQIWDTAGQERFRTLTNSYYRGAHAIALVYDVSVPSSFYGLTKWLEEAKKCSQSEDIIFLLIGNKIDLCCSEENMPVQRLTAELFAKQHHMLLAFTSAKTRVGISQAFDEVARNAYDLLVERGATNKFNTKNLNDIFSNKSSTACC